jgi:hypothetical protein
MRTKFGIACVAILLATALPAHADDTSNKEAGLRFQRAVSLYNEADYRGALAEFKRAYEIAPNVNVLYNVGQAYYQLQDYAHALTTFERYLADGGTGRKAEVENTLTVLRTRVGRVDIASNAVGAEVLLNDETVGKVPLAKPILVGVGKHRISLVRQGAATETRIVEVAAGETKALNFNIETAKASPEGQTSSPPQDAPKQAEGVRTEAYVGWVITGALAAGTVVTGVLALGSAGKLRDAREHLGETRASLDDRARTTTTLSIITDVLLIGTVAMGGLSLYWTLAHKGQETKVGISPQGFTLLQRF